MIDIENQVFTAIADALKAEIPNIFIYGESDLLPTTYPYVTIEETDNSVTRRYSDTGDIEHYVDVAYDINIYSNKRNAKKAECKAISKVVDKILSALGFTRISYQPIPTGDATTHRLALRYTAVVGKDNYIYGG